MDSNTLYGLALLCGAALLVLSPIIADMLITKWRERKSDREFKRWAQQALAEVNELSESELQYIGCFQEPPPPRPPPRVLRLVR